MNDLQHMPILRPVPIETAGLSWRKALSVWWKTQRKWEVMENWSYTLPDGTCVVIPKGYVFNGASVPRALRWLVSPIGISLVPSLLHDFGYEHDYLWRVNTRIGDDEPAFVKDPISDKVEDRQAVWDRLFRDVGTQVHGMEWYSMALYVVLRLAGFAAWNACRELAPKEVSPDLAN